MWQAAPGKLAAPCRLRDAQQCACACAWSHSLSRDLAKWIPWELQATSAAHSETVLEGSELLGRVRGKMLWRNCCLSGQY